MGLSLLERRSKGVYVSLEAGYYGKKKVKWSFFTA